MSDNIDNKKQIFKEFWFWIISIIIVLIILIGVKSSQEQNTPTYIQDTIKDNTLSEVVEKKEVIVIDFSQMSKEEIQTWCRTNKVMCDIAEQYSDTIEKGVFISQSIQAGSTAYEGEEITIIYSLGKEPTIGEKNALKAANDYLRFMAFSYSGLVEQLVYEGYTNQEAIYGVDNCGADWNEQAAKKAEQYINIMSFSRNGLIEQLMYEGFTAEQAEYGVSLVGY